MSIVIMIEIEKVRSETIFHNYLTKKLTFTKDATRCDIYYKKGNISMILEKIKHDEDEAKGSYLTIPYIKLFKYKINRYGYIFNTENNKFIDRYNDYTNKKIICKIIIDNKEQILPIDVLVMITFVGSMALPIYHKFGWKDCHLDSIKYIDYEIVKNNENTLFIANTQFKRYLTTQYFISSTGIIYSDFSKSFCRRRENEKEYIVCNLSDDVETRRINRLVYTAWKGPIPEGYEVNHINHRRWDNDISNLEAIPKYHNLRDSREFNDKKMLSRKEVYEICEALLKRVPTNKLCEKYKVDRNTIQNIKTGDSWKEDIKSWGFDFSDLHKDSPTGLTPEKVREVCDMIMSGKQLKEIAEITGINYNNISSIKCGNSWTNITKDYPKLSTAKANIGRSLTVDQVHEICKKLEKGGMPTALAKEYGVSQGTLMKIKEKVIWTDISSQYDFSKWAELKSGNKLTSSNVHDICKHIQDKTMTEKELSIKYNLSVSSINDISRGATWKNISSQYDLPYKHKSEK